MDLTELVQQVVELTVAIETGNIGTALSLFGDLSKVAGSLLNGFAAGGATDFGPLDAAVTALEEKAPVGLEAGAGAIDPAMILQLIQMVQLIVSLFKKKG